MDTQQKAPPALEPGDTVYSQEGHEAEFVAHSGGSYVVRPIFEDDDGPQRGDIETWSTIFRTPPAPKLDEQTAAAERRLNQVRTEVSALEARKYEFERAEQARKERITQHEALAEVDRYLAGEITHYVAKHSYYPTVEVIEVGRTVPDHSSSNGYGVLTLHPTKNWRGLTWSLYWKDRGASHWSTSDRTSRVAPCCGEEAAKAKAAEILQGYVAEYLALEPAKRSYTEHLIACCSQFGVEVPQAILDGLAEVRRARATHSIAEYRKKLEEAEAQLAAIDKPAGPA